MTLIHVKRSFLQFGAVAICNCHHFQFSTLTPSVVTLSPLGRSNPQFRGVTLSNGQSHFGETVRILSRVEFTYVHFITVNLTPVQDSDANRSQIFHFIGVRLRVATLGVVHFCLVLLSIGRSDSFQPAIFITLRLTY